MFHGISRQVWVFTKTLCDKASKRREDCREVVDESRKDVSGLAQIWVIPPAEKRSSQLSVFVKACADRMSQRRFANAR